MNGTNIGEDNNQVIWKNKDSIINYYSKISHSA